MIGEKMHSKYIASLLDGFYNGISDQTSQLSRFGRETHDLACNLTVSRLTLLFSRCLPNFAVSGRFNSGMRIRLHTQKKCEKNFHDPQPTQEDRKKNSNLDLGEGTITPTREVTTKLSSHYHHQRSNITVNTLDLLLLVEVACLTPKGQISHQT